MLGYLFICLLLLLFVAIQGRNGSGINVVSCESQRSFCVTVVYIGYFLDSFLRISRQCVCAFCLFFFFFKFGYIGELCIYLFI